MLGEQDETKVEPWFRKFIEDNGVTPADLVSAAQSLAHFISATTSAGFATLDGVVEDSGMHKLKPATLMALMFRLGQSAVSAYFYYAREALAMGAKPYGFDGLEDGVSAIKY